MSKYTPVIHLPGEPKKYLPGHDNLYEACTARIEAWATLPHTAIKTLINANNYKAPKEPEGCRQYEVK